MPRARYDALVMTLFLAADHNGHAIKEALEKTLAKHKVAVHDLSPQFKKGDDYPAIGKRLATTVAKTAGARGVLFCGSGVGMAIAANRVKGARAVEGLTKKQVALARKDNDVNILTLGAWDLSQKEALALINTFLTTKASTAERHKRRVMQLG